MKSPEPFTPDSMMWKINRERVVLLCGPTAAVLQVAHPQIAHGVARHSDFRRDPMGRLSRTLDAVYSVAFGNAETIREVSQKVASRHRAVQGNSYSAFDPGAQLWVLATLIMGSVGMYETFVEKLTREELDRFLADYRRFGEAFGPGGLKVPDTWQAFEVYWESMISGTLLGSDPVCAEVANAIIKPDAPRHYRALSPIMNALITEQIPPELREKLQLPKRGICSGMWKGMKTIIPPLLPRLPAMIRFAPQYRAALESWGA